MSTPNKSVTLGEFIEIWKKTDHIRQIFGSTREFVNGFNDRSTQLVDSVSTAFNVSRQALKQMPYETELPADVAQQVLDFKAWLKSLDV